MKLKLFTIFSAALLAASCQNSFEPKTEFIPQYVLYAIINGDTTYQQIIVSKSYDVEGYNPNDFTGDEFVRDAEINVLYNNSIFTLTDTIIKIDGDREIPVYYSNSLQPSPGSTLNLTAENRSGLNISAATTMPRSNNLTFLSNVAQSDVFIDGAKSDIFLEWDLTGISDKEVLFFPKLMLNYIHKEENNLITKDIEVPITYNQQMQPEYPAAISTNRVSYNFNSLLTVLEDISKGDSLKSNYAVTGLRFQLMIMDNNLGAYYLTTKKFLDGYTVILDHSDYTNIKGGWGVFGGFFKREHRLSIAPDIIRRYGYRLNF